MTSANEILFTTGKPRKLHGHGIEFLQLAQNKEFSCNHEGFLALKILSIYLFCLMFHSSDQMKEHAQK